jgi:hypothetical protein
VSDLSTWLLELQQKMSLVLELSPLKVLLEPTQQQIGDRILEVTFIADMDNLPLEFIRFLPNSLSVENKS